VDTVGSPISPRTGIRRDLCLPLATSLSSQQVDFTPPSRIFPNNASRLPLPPSPIHPHPFCLLVLVIIDNSQRTTLTMSFCGTQTRKGIRIVTSTLLTYSLKMDESPLIRHGRIHFALSATNANMNAMSVISVYRFLYDLSFFR
jgi:hypothetical protein